MGDSRGLSAGVAGGYIQGSAPWPSGKAADCKSAIRRFDSDRRLCGTTSYEVGVGAGRGGP